jgi:AcrR family transcriptional regulator
MQATAYILVRGGYDAMTTNQIADRAGVNIASLYQYFPNKQAIVAALMQRHAEQVRGAVLGELAHPGQAPAARIRRLVEIMAAVHAVEPELHAAFTVLGPQLGLGSIHTELDEALAAESRAWVREMKGTLPDPELALWVAATAIHAVFHAAFVEQRPLASSPRLVDELVRLVTPYLVPARQPARQVGGGSRRTRPAART